MSSIPEPIIAPIPLDAPHILIVDDDKRIRALLGRYLGQNGFIVTEADSASMARQLIDFIQFDLVVLDIMMPGEDGLSLTQSLKANGFNHPILLLTAKSEAEARIAGLEAGADDYLGKPFEPRELVLRIQAILKRSASVTPSTTVQRITIDGWSFDPQRSQLIKENQTEPLTKAEATLLGIFTKRLSTSISRQELAQLAGLEGQERTIDVQVTRLRRKIEPDPRKPRFLQTVRGEGYILFGDDI